jgi:hypothetical protein
MKKSRLLDERDRRERVNVLDNDLFYILSESLVKLPWSYLYLNNYELAR